MSLRISGKHMEIGDAFRTRIENRITEAVEKYFDGGFSGRVTLEKEKAGSRFSADCTLHLDTGAVLQATGQAQDPQIAFDAAAERIEKRLRRYNRRLRSHSPTQRGNGAAEAAESDMTYRVMTVPDDDDEVPEDYAPTVVAETRLPLKTMSVAAAVEELDMKDSPVFVFRNAGNNQVNIVYRRSDGNIGWIDPSVASSG